MQTGDTWVVRVVGALIQDLRVGARGFAKKPGYATAVILTLGLGIGANTAIFSVIRGVFFKALPFADSERLVVLRQPVPSAGIPSLNFSVSEVQDYRERARSLEALVEYSGAAFTLEVMGEAQRVKVGVVSAAFFDVLGVPPQLGRAFLADEDRLGADPVVLLTRDFWQGRLGGDARVLGRGLRMDDRVFTVVGVLPPLPEYPSRVDVYVPVSAGPFRSRPQTIQDRGSRVLLAFARLKQGSSLDQAESDLRSVLGQLREEYPDAYSKDAAPTVSVTPIREELTREARPAFAMLFAAVGFLLLLACANVANLTLARVWDRSRELAVRSALGAGRGRLLQQLSTESLVLSLVGGLLALAVAAAASSALVRFASRFTPRANEIRVDWTVLLFALAASVLAGLAVGTVCTLAGTERLASALAARNRATADRRHQRLRAGLVAGQVAFSVVLLIGAGLMLRSLGKLRGVDPGFADESVLTVGLELDSSSYLTSQRRFDVARFGSFHDSLLKGVRALPGVVAAGSAVAAPLTDYNWEEGFRIEESPDRDGLPRTALKMPATSGYFEALGVRLLRGRTFQEEDSLRGSDALIVNRSLARHHFGGGDPVGKRISFDEGASWRTIVGVVADVRQASLDRQAPDTAYAPFLQSPAFSSSLFVRTLGDPSGVAPGIRALVRQLDPRVSISDVRSLEQVHDRALDSPRLTTRLLGLFALLALAVSATGIAGAIGFAVDQRTQEIGIRLALGASPRLVLGMILRQGLEPVVLGACLGLAAGLGLSRLLSTLLFGVEPTDPLSFVGAAAVLLLVAAMACLIPARRAAMTDPAVVLRAE